MADEASYETLKVQLLKSGSLYEDPDFPATARSLKNSGVASSRIRWMRPKEISYNAKFVVQGETRFDLNQGELGDCWFIAATATLAVTNGKLLERVVPPDQSFKEKYAGIFRFNLWRFDHWQEIIVDDRLPTLNGKLVFGHNKSQPNEFWVPLFEKAYAKVYGSYENIDGGFINTALVDFTGGVSEDVRLRKKSELPDNLFELMFRMFKMNSMMGCSINTDSVREEELKTGLYAGHAYSITNFVQGHVDNKPVRLLRLRNPWGTGEWKGDWGDNSSKWYKVSQADRTALGIKRRDDGEFWMSFEDWVANFETLRICHLYPDAITEEVARDTNKQPWNVVHHHGFWVKGVNAGGCGNRPYKELFWTNPQLRLHLKDSDDDNKDGLCTVIISLMQKSNDFSLFIGFHVYQVMSSARRLSEGDNYSQHSLIRRSDMAPATNLREITTRLQLKPGSYVVIPYTFVPNKEGGFLVRMYTEKKAESSVIDGDNEVDTPDEPMEPSEPSTPPAPPKKKEKLDDQLKELFTKYAGPQLQMDAEETKKALNVLLGGEDAAKGFSTETARSMMCMMDRNESGFLDFTEFRKMIKELFVWKKAFHSFDKDNSGSIDARELRAIFKVIGLTLSAAVVVAATRRYGGKTGKLSLEDFVLVCSRLIIMYNLFVKTSTGGVKGTANFKLDEWLTITMNY
ncbi:Calpain-B [Lamellibrachia satsuma]|nr:Calpain-B [Lamellibrachia satsuma]